jgi:septum formation protein
LSLDIRPAPDVKECFPPHLKGGEIPVYLARMKADAYALPLAADEILITADTIVWHRGSVLGKPSDRAEALRMLEELSGDHHMVYTGVCLRYRGESRCFCAETKVFFRDLSEAERIYYVDHFAPYDKAGAYGIQEWIGYVGVERIEGSYFNVMGLPVQRVYQELNSFVHEVGNS